MSQHSITAIVYDRKGRVLSVGRNSYVKTHPIQAQAAAKVGKPEKVFLHAEISALVQLSDWKQAHRMQVIRMHKDGQPACAKPCTICMEVIRKSGIRVIDHT